MNEKRKIPLPYLLTLDNTHNIHLKNFILEPMEDGAKREILEATTDVNDDIFGSIF